MPILISAHRLKKSFGARPLFEELTFSIDSMDRVGLIGPNGAGKSTLLRILAGQTSPDSGEISRQRGLRVGYLEQTPSFLPGATVLSTVLEGASDPHDGENVGLAHEFLSRLALDGSAETQINSESRVDQLSGGWKKRAALARELMKKPDLLLLDEPTNHLDVESIIWLEKFLAGARFATITITHDRLFLQRISNRILELDPRNPGGLLSIQGSYADYLETKENVLAAQERREWVLKNTLRRETEWLRRGAKARTTKQQARINRAGDLQDELEEVSVRNQSRLAKLEFQSADKAPKKLIEAKGISKTLGGVSLFRELNLLVTPGTRIGLLGANGSGKSTLLRVLLGELPPDSGTVVRSEHLVPAYFEQNREALDPTLTVAQTICPRGEWVDYRGDKMHVRSYLDRFLFSQAQMDMAVGKLSGGEQSRLLLARLMLEKANVLVLDEPTNDLDLATLSVLQDCLTEFQGAALFVTHDRAFLDQVATRILAFGPEAGKVTALASLEQWEAWHEEAVAKVKASAAAAAPVQTVVTAPADAPKKKRLSYKEQREYDAMEERIQTAEAALARLSEESLLPANVSNAIRLGEITREMTKLQNEVDELYARWSELEAKVQ